jgi:hypothetical protein
MYAFRECLILNVESGCASSKRYPPLAYRINSEKARRFPKTGTLDDRRIAAQGLLPAAAYTIR